MKLQVVSNFKLVNNEATSCFRAQTSQEWNHKLIPISNNRKRSYKLFSTSNDCGMTLQVVFNFKRVKNETTSWFQFQTSLEWNCFQLQTSLEWIYKLFTDSNESRMKLQADSNFKQPKMKLQVVFNFIESGTKLQVISNFNLVNNKATSSFQLQTSLEWIYKLFPTSI